MPYVIGFENKQTPAGLQDALVKLQKLLGLRFSAAEADRILAGKDFWPLTNLWFMEGKAASLPDAVVWPESTAEVAEIVKIARHYKVPLIPFGEGSGVLGGITAVNGGIVMDMKRMNRIIEIDQESLLLTVETGINGEVLERKLQEKGFTLRHTPQSVRCSTLGGWISCRAAGQFSTKYGKIEDMLCGLQAVLPDGSIYQNTITPRSATGPRIDQLLLGAEGTLGVITRAVLKIWRLPEKQIGRAFAFSTVEDALTAVREILQSNIKPAVVRIYDAAETQLHFKDIEAARDRVMLVLVMEGTEKLAAVENEIAQEYCEKWQGIDCGPEPVADWFRTRFNVSLSSHLIQNGLVYDTIEIAAPWSKIAPLYHEVIKALKEVPKTIAAGGHFSHVYHDGACLYLSVAGMPDAADKEVYYHQLWDAAMNTTMAMGGTISHHHGIGLNRSRFMRQELGEAGLSMLKAVKKALDPDNIMNPGKLGLGGE